MPKYREAFEETGSWEEVAQPAENIPAGSIKVTQKHAHLTRARSVSRMQVVKWSCHNGHSNVRKTTTAFHVFTLGSWYGRLARSANRLCYPAVFELDG